MSKLTKEIEKAYGSAKEIVEPSGIIKFWNAERNDANRARGLPEETQKETLAYLLGAAHGRLLTLKRDRALRKAKADRPGAWKSNWIRVETPPDVDPIEAEVNALNVKALRKRAADLKIEGRSKMETDELRTAVIAALKKG